MFSAATASIVTDPAGQWAYNAHMCRQRRHRWTIPATITLLGVLLMACQPQSAQQHAARDAAALPDALQHALAMPGIEQDGQGSEPANAIRKGPSAPQPANESVDVAQSSACLAQAGNGMQRGGTLRRWTDDNGHTHYSDRVPPSGMAATTISAGGVQASISGDGMEPGLDQRVQVHLAQLEALFTAVLGLPSRPAARLDITLVAQQEALAGLIATPLAASSSGAYVPAQQRIYLHRHEDDAAFEQILRHELAHAMVHRMVGQLPVPLNEGLAGWYQHGGVDAPEGHAAVALQQALVDAAPDDPEQAWVDLLASESLHFHRDEREKSYLRAYALVAVLMADGSGRRTLAGIMQAQRRQPCVPVAWELEIAAHHPGGLTALMNDWQGFMNSPKAWMAIASRRFAST